ncbi:VOC family protein [Streptomyces sp. NPDC003015]
MAAFGAVQVNLWCDDVERCAAFFRSPTDSPDGRLRFSWLRDPEGHRVKLVQERG